jgi:hypothetical protein
MTNTTPFRFVDASLDEVRIWNQALPATTISNWMNITLTTNHPNYANILLYLPLDGPATNTIISGGTFQVVGGYNPFQISLLVSGMTQATWSGPPYTTTLTSSTPRRLNLMCLTVDGYSNSRYSAVCGVTTMLPLDSDLDGVPDYLDPFPFDPLRWTIPNPGTNTTPPTITITEP